MKPHPIRLLIVDDQAIVRKGTMALLSLIEGIDVVGEAVNGLEAVLQSATLQPDVILMDLMMPIMDGVEAIRQISVAQPQSRILALTSFIADDKLFPAIKAGALGYMVKDCEPEDLVKAIRQVHRGEPSLHPSVARKVLAELRQPPQSGTPTPDPLTERELDVLRLIATGFDNDTIAERLNITEVTVRTHLSHILDKLHLANRVQATLYALRTGLTSLEDEAMTGE